MNYLIILSVFVLSSSHKTHDCNCNRKDTSSCEVDWTKEFATEEFEPQGHCHKRKEKVDVAQPSANSTHLEYSYYHHSPMGPKNWYKTYPQCGGHRQSPINIDTNYCLLKDHKQSLGILRGKVYPKSVKFLNDGYDIKITLEYESGRPLLIGGPLKSSYVLRDLHYHWGLKSGDGSEHAIDDFKGDIELHIVFWNVKYGNFSNALGHRDGLSVIGVLYEESHHTEDSPMFKNLRKIIKPMSSWTKENPKGFRMRDFVGSMEESFISYQGSLTAPPCSEAVTWIVKENIQKISPKDMHTFRKILTMGNHHEAPNFRPIQKVNGRKCYFY